MKKSAVGGMVALALASAVTITACIGSSGFKNSDLKTWFNSWGHGNEIVAPDNTDKPDGTGGEDNKKPVNQGSTTDGSVISGIEDNGLTLLSAALPREAFSTYGISERADSAYLLTINVTPLGATDFFDWSITGNEDGGVTLNGEAGSNTATVVCNGAFETQKTVTVTSRTNPAMKASCNVDYYKRFESVTLDAPTSIKLQTTATDYAVSLMPQYGVGSLLDTTVTIKSMSIKCIGQMYSNSIALYNGMEANAYKTEVGDASSGKFTLKMTPTEVSSFFNRVKGVEIEGLYSAYFQKFVMNCGYESEHYEIDVEWEATRGGEVLDSGTLTALGRFDASDLQVAATDVTLSDSTILF